MVTVVTNADEGRNQSSIGWVSKGLAFSASALVAATAAGAILGAVGGTLPGQARAAIASLLGVAGIALGVTELLRGRLLPFQLDRETPQRWMDRGPMEAAVGNGVTLGIGASSRLGFWLWYVIPTSALLVGQPLVGAAIYGTYGLVRGTSLWWIMIWTFVAHRMRGASFLDVSNRLLSRAIVASQLAAANLVVVGVLTCVAIGI